MKIAICLVLLEFHTGYGIYQQDKQIRCEDRGRVLETGQLHEVDCAKSMSRLRLSKNEHINNTIRYVQISSKGYEYGKECFYE